MLMTNRYFINVVYGGKLIEEVSIDIFSMQSSYNSESIVSI